MTCFSCRPLKAERWWRETPSSSLNLEHNVVGSALDTPAALLALDRLRSLASSPELLVASHDPANMDRFPKSADGVLEIA